MEQRVNNREKTVIKRYETLENARFSKPENREVYEQELAVVSGK